MTHESRVLDRFVKRSRLNRPYRSGHMETMAERLSKALTLRGMTASDLIRQKVLSKAGIYFILDGTTTAEKIRATTVAKLCKALDVNREWLLTGRGPIKTTASQSQQPSQLGRPDLETLRLAMRLLSYVSQQEPAPVDFSEDADALLAAYDLVSLKPSDLDLEDASQRMLEFLDSRRSDERVDGRNAVGPRRKGARKG